MAIDLKSFYASVECVERGLDPLTAHLVVADPGRTAKTICLAVSPALKAHGIRGRARLFEVEQEVARINAVRRATGEKPLTYITAPPRMALYIDYSVRVYEVYLRYIAPEDIHVYSIDEVFIDVTPYLKTYGLTAAELGSRLVREVLAATGITATVGIGTNLYLCKVAMDILAKNVVPDENGVRMATLDEAAYRRELWAYRPITDFWRVGRGIARQLQNYRLFTMGDVARCSLRDGWLLYKLFGVNAELLIDHAWGVETCTLADIKAYRPAAHGTSMGQVLQRPYSWKEARLIVREMADQLSMELVAKGLATDQVVLDVGYDTENLTDLTRRAQYDGAVITDPYGRAVPRPVHGTMTLSAPTASTAQLMDTFTALFEHITDPVLTVRRLTLAANRLQTEPTVHIEQLSLFDDPVLAERREQQRQRERRLQEALLQVRRRYGKNAILRGMNFEEESTARERNEQIGGHRA